MSLPLQFVVMVAFAVVFLISHLGDMLLVGHAKPRWGLYIAIGGLTGVPGAALNAWNYIRESRRPYSKIQLKKPLSLQSSTRRGS